MVDSTRKTPKFSFRPRPAAAQRMITHMTPMRGGPLPVDREFLNNFKELNRLTKDMDPKLVESLTKPYMDEVFESPVENRAKAQRRREEETERPVEKKKVMALRKRRREEETKCPAKQAGEVQRKRRKVEETERPVEKKRVMALRKRRREEETECPTEQADKVQRKRRREEETERPVEKKRVMALRKRRREKEGECPAEQADEVQRKRRRQEETERPVESRAKAQRRGEEEAEKRAKAPRKRSREKAEKGCKALREEGEAEKMRREEKTESPVKRRKAPGNREEETGSPSVKRGKAQVKRKKKAESPTKKRHKASGKREEGTESPVDKTLQNKGDEEKIKMLLRKITDHVKISKKKTEIMKQNEERMEKESRVPGCLYPESFIFHKLLGSGCHGKVMLATHCDSGKVVAIKISAKLYLTFNDRDSIMKERQVMQMVIGNPYCSKLYATFQTEDHLYYVMEFCSGGELSKQIESKKLCDLPTMRRLAAELLCGLQFMHSKGILHSDVNPENILLDCKGHVRLADFGNAVTNMFGSETTTGKCGTVSYMAPELLKDEPFDKAVDYFALGVILFEAAFGIYPFNIKNPQASICHETPRYPIGADDALVDFLNKLLCKDQKKRKAYVAKIRNHRFFRGINWEQLEAGKLRAPFSACRKDLKEEMTKKTILMTQTTLNVYKSLKYAGKYSRKTQERFKGFTFVSDEWKAIQNLKTKNTKS